jgi:hypothetical protein
MLHDNSEDGTEVDGEAIALGDNLPNFNASMEEDSDGEEVEECTRDDAVSLVGVKLGGVAIGDDDGEELPRARQQATPRSQPSPSQ